MESKTCVLKWYTKNNTTKEEQNIIKIDWHKIVLPNLQNVNANV